jgi:hypothetical protein
MDARHVEIRCESQQSGHRNEKNTEQGKSSNLKEIWTYHRDTSCPFHNTGRHSSPGKGWLSQLLEARSSCRLREEDSPIYHQAQPMGAVLLGQPLHSTGLRRLQSCQWEWPAAPVVTMVPTSSNQAGSCKTKTRSVGRSTTLRGG